MPEAALETKLLAASRGITVKKYAPQRETKLGRRMRAPDDFGLG